MSSEIAEKAKRFTCPALRAVIKDKEVAKVMSNELMATIRNNTYIPVEKRYKLIDQINFKTRKETEMKKQLQEIEKSLNCPVPEERIAGTTLKGFIESQRRLYLTNYHKEPTKEFLENAINYAKYMEIIDKRKDDPRVQGNR